MRGRRLFVGFGLLVALLASPETVFGGAMEEESQQERKQVDTRLRERQQELERVQRARAELESTVKEKDRSLDRLDRIRRDQEYNLEQSRKRSENLANDLAGIQVRLGERRALLLAAVDACQPSLHSPAMVVSARRKALAQIADHLLSDVRAIESQVEKIAKSLEFEEGYRDRIVNKYMPNEATIKSQIEERAELTRVQLEERKGEEFKIASDVARLAARATALEKVLRSLRTTRVEPPPAPAGKKSERSPRVEKPAAYSAPFVPGTAFPLLRGRLPLPVVGEIKRGFGPYTHPTAAVTLESKGLDILVNGNSHVRAVADGKVLVAGAVDRYGQIVALEHGGGYVTVYGNVKPNDLQIEQIVKAGRILGTVQAANGDAILHFEIRQEMNAIDPQPWLGK